MLKDALESSGLFIRAMKRHQDQHDSLEGFAYAEWEESPEVDVYKRQPHGYLQRLSTGRGYV